MYQITHDNIPDWATEIFTSKGLGFEKAGLHSLIWDYYVSQFSHMDIEQAEHEQYYAHMLTQLIKEGSIDKAIDLLRELEENGQGYNSITPKSCHHSPLHLDSVTQFEEKMENHLARTHQPRPVRLSAMTIFEEKVKNYLGEEYFNTEELFSTIALPHPTRTARQDESELLWEAYQALLTEDQEKQKQITNKLKQYFSIWSR